MIVERDIGRLAKYTFDMGGAGDLLSLSLSVPPWEDLHELSRDELRLTNLVTTDAVAEVLPQINSAQYASGRTCRLRPCRIVSSAARRRPSQARQPAKSTKTAEAMVPTGGVAAPTPAQQ